MNGWRLLGLLATLAFALAGCSAPVSAVRVDRVDAYRDLTRSVVTTGQPSLSTRDVLLERGFLEAFDEDPEATLADLHQLMVATAGDRDVLFALA
jgi:hypothetical protein